MSKEIDIRLDDLYAPVSFGGGGGGGGSRRGSRRGSAGRGGNSVAKASLSTSDYVCAGVGYVVGAATKSGGAGTAAGLACTYVSNSVSSGPSYAEMSNARGRFYTPPPNVSEPTSGPR